MIANDGRWSILAAEYRSTTICWDNISVYIVTIEIFIKNKYLKNNMYMIIPCFFI